jgi:uncharacterized membrane protein YdfJ with MMPL/SSD domain
MRVLGVFAILALLAIGLVALPKHGNTATRDFPVSQQLHVTSMTGISFPGSETVNVVLTTDDDPDNPTEAALIKSLTDSLKTSQYVNFSTGTVEDSADDAVNLRVLSTKITDTTSSVSVAVVLHSKGHFYSTYLFQTGGVVHKENADGDAEVLLGMTQQAYVDYISDLVKQ